MDIEGLTSTVAEVELTTRDDEQPDATAPENIVEEIAADDQPERIDLNEEDALRDLEATVSINGGPEIPMRLAHAAVAHDALFNDAAYVNVPTMDGQATDTLTIAFGGTISYDASDDTGRDLFERLTLGKSVELRVSALVVKTTGAYKISANDEETVTGSRGLKVDNIWLVPAENL